MRHPRCTALFLIPMCAFWMVPPGAAANDETGAISVLVKSRIGLSPEVMDSIVASGAKPSYVWPEIGALKMRIQPSKLADLIANPNVALVEVDRQGSAEGSRIDPASSTPSPDGTLLPWFESVTPILTWNQSMAQTTGSGYDGTGVTVAVVDSGLPQNWPEFLPPGSVDLEHAAGFGAEGWGDFHNPLPAVSGTGGHIGLFPHGLAVSSIIVGFPSEFGLIGGAAPGVKILPIRVLDQFNYGWFSWFTAGIMHVAHLKADGSLPGPVVINFSIQAGSNSMILKDAIDYAISQGVIFVTIAGNFGPGPGTIAFPGRLPESITAGAVGWVGQFSTPQWFFSPVPLNDPTQVYLAPFSGWEFPFDPPASRVDVVAPGSFVFGEWLFGPGFSEGREVAHDAIDNYIFGTSFACPHVVGVVAQMLQKNPHLTQTDVEAILRSTALPMPGNPAASGKGLLRGTAAVAATTP